MSVGVSFQGLNPREGRIQSHLYLLEVKAAQETNQIPAATNPRQFLADRKNKGYVDQSDVGVNPWHCTVLDRAPAVAAGIRRAFRAREGATFPDLSENVGP